MFSKKNNSLILEFFDRKDRLTIKNKNYKKNILDFFIKSIKYDEGERDETSFSIFSKNKTISAQLISKDQGILCGLEEIKLLLDHFDLQYKFHKKEGDKVMDGERLLDIDGIAYKVLLIERTLINVLSRMSGIASLTRQFVSKVDGKIKILGTRKTIWNLLDKKAISQGGGLTHRINLDDFILIKDNHLAAVDGDIELALEKSSLNKNIDFIEIEVDKKKDAITAAQFILSINNNKKYAIMFDNMKSESIKNIIKEIGSLSPKKIILFEASGGINSNNIKSYINTGVDAVSLGCLTHSVRSLDFSLKVIK
ncbi:carboxylating nicotinate-nucleotide diphosphorylase [Patescibacteria group bacterium]|nr:carboxylating nicotinate-nucleotide diphosphorylase [Patescibacteria group bacterium]